MFTRGIGPIWKDFGIFPPVGDLKANVKLKEAKISDHKMIMDLDYVALYQMWLNSRDKNK
jgi:hypothetical protein